MDIYSNPSPDTYVKGITKLFTMPTDSGGVPAVAVSKGSLVYISSAYTILIVFIFMIGWNLILAITMEIWSKSGNPDGLSLLDDIRNSGESMNATRITISYCKREILIILGRKPKDVSPVLESKGASSVPERKDAPSTPESKDVSSIQESKDIQPCSVVAHRIPETRLNDNSPNKEISRVTQEEQNETLESSSASKAKRKWRNLVWDLGFLSIAVAMAVGNLVVRVF